MSTSNTNSHELVDATAARIVADTLDAVVYADRTGTIRMWNGGAERLFGHSAGEAIGRSLDMIIPEKHRRAHWQGWDRVMSSGTTRYGANPLAVPGLRADGSRVSLEFSITMLKDADGEIEGVAAIMRDVTKRWEETRRLREQVREQTRGEQREGERADPAHPYSPARRVGDHVYVSGALSVDEAYRPVGDSDREALDAALQRMQERLATAGAGLDDVVKLTYFVTDVAVRDLANEQFTEHFATARPARTFVEASGLPYGASIEIDAIAVLNQQQ